MNQVMQIEPSLCTSPALAEDTASSPVGPMVFTVGQGSAPVLKLVSPVEGGAPQLIKVVPAMVSTADAAQQEGRAPQQNVYSIVQKGVGAGGKGAFNGQQRVHTLSALPPRALPTAAVPQKVQILSNVVVSKQNIVLNKNSLQAQRQIITTAATTATTTTTTPLAQKQLVMKTVGGAKPQKTIKTLSPQSQSPQQMKPTGIKTLPPANKININQRVGIKTLAPQKPNYIGKHATQATKSQLQQQVQPKMKRKSLRSPSPPIGEEVKPDFSPNLSYLYQVVMLDHNYGAPPPAAASPAVPPNGATLLNNNVHEDDAASTISSDEVNDPEGEETETALEGEGDEDGVTRCICDFDHDDGYMICCDVCSSWQHVDCMGLDRDHIPDKYSCVRCLPRRVDRVHARALQQRKREEFALAALPPPGVGAVAIADSGNHSDTSSDSTDTDTDRDRDRDRDRQSVSLNNNVLKRRSAPVSVSARRKSEPVRRAPLPRKRQQRRESAAAAAATAHKKKIIKRKIKSRSSVDESSQDSWPSTYSNLGTSLLQLRQWIENYEEAVTNHYSPELRARITNMRANGHQDAHAPQAPLTAAHDVQVQKCRVANQQLTGIKIVLASQTLQANTPVIELRGKYMLSTQHRSSGGGAGLLTRQHAQRPGPFLFFYRLPRDGTEVCVDTRTYGNAARFIRRSCRPNAELRHLVEKGTLHLYIITTSSVDKNTELTLRHESHDLAAVASGPTVVPCACGGTPATCMLYSHRTNINGTEQQQQQQQQQQQEEPETTRKRRGRRASSPRRATPPPSPQHSPEREKEPEIPKEDTQMVTRRRAVSGDKEDKEEEETLTVKEAKDKKKKLTREERKMEAIMKAFERLEKAEQRKQEVQARQAQRHVEPPPSPSAPVAGPTNVDIDRTRRKKRKGRARTVSTTSQSSTRRRTRLNSTDSYITSGDEGSLLSPPLPVGAPPHAVEDADAEAEEFQSPKKIDSQSDLSSPGQVTTAAGLLLALANGGAPQDIPALTRTAVIAGSPALTPTTPTTPILTPTTPPPPPKQEKVENDSSGSNSLTSSPTTPLSSACLLVAAAVGPLEPGFKFPKTKKAIMNEWLNKSPEQTPPPEFQPQPPVSPLATLVQAATLCDAKSVSGNAKKRWLRQAISEEDVQNQEPVAPPKKRRLARESLSPPTTPTMLVPPNTLDDEEFYDTEEPGGLPRPPVFRDSAQLLGTVEKTIRFYEESLTIATSTATPPPPPEESPDADPPPEELPTPLQPSPLQPSPPQPSSPAPPPSPPQVPEHPKPEAITPAKRKLSISEYRQRKQQKHSPHLDRSTSPASPTPTSSGRARPRSRSRSASSSSTTSSLSSDEETAIEESLGAGAEPPKVLVAFDSAPTAVERQRENVERIKKAFGLSLDDDARKTANLISPVEEPSPPKKVLPPPKKAPFEESTSFIPPFNNPVYPNSAQFTSFSSVIDSSPYEGRNPSPPPAELLKSNSLK